MGRHDGLAQLKRCGAQDGAVHGTGVQVAGTSVERRKADDNSNRQNAPHNQNLTRFPARRQLHKQGAVLADDDEVTNSAFFVALHMSHFGPCWKSRDVRENFAGKFRTHALQQTVSFSITSSLAWARSGTAASPLEYLHRETAGCMIEPNSRGSIWIIPHT
jgi:hypothetical protein